MTRKYETLHQDLKESLKRSQEFQIGLETIFSNVTGTGFSPKAKKSLLTRQGVIDHADKILSERSKHRGSKTDCSPVIQRATEPSPERSPRASKLRQGRFRSKIREFSHHLAMVKTGKVRPNDFSEGDFVSRILQDSLTPTSRTSTEAASVLQRSFDTETRTLPHVSFISGRTAPSVTLPTYEQYCKTNQIGVAKDDTGQYLRRVDQRIVRLEKLKKQLNGLDVLLSARETWDGDRDLLEKLGKHPAQKGTSLKTRFCEESAEMNLKEKRQVSMRRRAVIQKNHRQPRVQLDKKRYETENVLKVCADQFESAKNRQAARLEDILQRLAIERPFQLKEKSRLFDTGKFSATNSAQVFNSLRRTAESARGQRVEQARTQVNIYETMLRYLQTQSPPTDNQLLCLEVIRRILEEGWVLTLDVCDQISSVLDTSEPALHALLDVVRNALV